MYVIIISWLLLMSLEVQKLVSLADTQPFRAHTQANDFAACDFVYAELRHNDVYAKTTMR
jgi:hypothetical protein